MSKCCWFLNQACIMELRSWRAKVCQTVRKISETSLFAWFVKNKRSRNFFNFL